MKHIPSRQVHLDFHTSELMPDVGARFSKKQFQAALKASHVNSITVFAKCHHSMSYYPTKIGTPHPNLRCNLLKGQIEAAHEIGVRAPIYFTIGWSSNDAENHPEWVVRRKDGTQSASNLDLNAKPTDPRPIVSWKHLCPSGAYLKMILDQTAEICAMFDVDGFFYDICFGPTCYCDNCTAGMKSEGIDPADDGQAAAYNQRKWHHVMTECNRIVHESHPKATVFYNGGANALTPQYHDWQTHFELEDLPTTWGGYDKFPIRARYFIRKGKDMVAQSGKFHTMWGEFGGFKHPDAIRFEAAAMIAFGARCGFGDQAHPSGEMDMETYRNIGHAYKYVEKIEEYGLDGRPCASLGLWWSMSGGGAAPTVGGSAPSDQGVANMLLESQIDFEVVSRDEDASRFAAIVVSGRTRLSDEDAACLSDYLKAGGRLLILGEGGLKSDGSDFALDVGAQYEGPARFQNDYLVAGKELRKGLVRSPFLNYRGALRARLTTARALAAIKEPYFDRTYEHYCSHQNTPYQLDDAPHPGAWMTKRIVYLPHPVGEMYYRDGARIHRDLFVNALRLVYPEKRQVLSVGMPSGARVSLVHQPERKRYVAHLLYGPPMSRGRCQVIEDLVPLYGIPVTLRVGEKIRRARLPLEKVKLKMEKVAEGVRVFVPCVQAHQMVVFEY